MPQALPRPQKSPSPASTFVDYLQEVLLQDLKGVRFKDVLEEALEVALVITEPA